MSCHHRILVFSQWRMILDVIAMAFDLCAIRYERIDGQTPAEERQESVSRFNASTDIPYLIESLQT